MKKTDTKPNTRTHCHCGRKAMYTVKVNYIWRGTVSTPDEKTLRVFSRANQTEQKFCEDCYPGSMLQLTALVPALPE